MKHRLVKLQFGKWLALLGLVAVTTVQATDYGDLRIQIENLSPGAHEHGYIEYRATITNRSAAQAHRVTLRFPATFAFSDTDALRAMTRTVEVAPQSTVTVSLLKPPIELAGSGVGVAIDGVWQNEAIAIAASPFQYDIYGGGRHSSHGRILLSPNVKKSSVLSQMENALPEKSFQAEALEILFHEWSRNWLAYSSYDCVMVTGNEWRAAPAEVREALHRYVESGGTLLLFAKWDAPNVWQNKKEVTTWQEPGADPTANTIRAEEPNPQATPTPAPTPTPVPIKVTTDLERTIVGFGVVMATDEQSQLGLTSAQWQAVAEQWQYTRSSLNGGGYSYGNTNTLVGNIQTPVRGLFVLMLLFVLVIGPLNLLLLSRWRKRIWLLWTVPAISLLTCLTVVGYAMFSEGLRGYEGVRCLTLLDETSRRATSLGFVGFYSPLTPGEGLHFSPQTEATRSIAYNYWRRNSGFAGTLDWTNDQHFASGWIAARVPVDFRLRKSETRRERLTINSQPDGNVSVVNGFGVPIEKLWYANARGELLEATGLIAAGASARLVSNKKVLDVAGAKTMPEPLSDYRSENIFFVEENPEQFLRPGHYLIVLDGAPFLESALANLRERRARTLVYGIPAQP